MRDQEIMAQHLPAIYRMAWTLTGNEADAQDLAHDTMVAALTSLSTFRAESQMSTWLMSILINRHRTWRRSHAIHSRLQPKVEAARPGPADDAADPEQLAALHAALDRLDADERELIALSFYQGLDSSEIGAILQRPAGTVRSRLHDVREKLRALLSEMNIHAVDP